VVAQELLLGALGGQHIGVEQGVELAAERLVTVFDAEQLAAGVSRLLFALLRVGQQTAPQLGDVQQPGDQSEVAPRLDLGECPQPVGAAGIARGEGQLAVLGARRRPGEVIRLRIQGFAVLVDPQERRIEVVARELEVVRVAAEERDAELRREHQADVLVAFVGVQIVDAAVVERDDLTPQVRRALAGLLELRDLGLHRLAAVLVALARASALHPRRDVGDLDQHVHGLRRAALLVCRGLGVETITHVIAFGRGEFVDAGLGAVMVGHHQAVLGHEAARAAALEPQR
jgi:hypothetical protein